MLARVGLLGRPGAARGRSRAEGAVLVTVSLRRWPEGGARSPTALGVACDYSESNSPVYLPITSISAPPVTKRRTPTLLSMRVAFCSASSNSSD